ncbi:MAG: outer membrane protein assembly factor BamB [Rhodospirillaceae bacterium]
MTLARLAIAVATVAVLASCQTVGDAYDRLFGSSRPGHKPAELVAFTPTAQPRILWQANVGSAEKSVFFPGVSGNAVFAGSAAGRIAGFQANSGASLSSFSIGERLAGGVGASASLILASTPKGEVIAYDRSGKLLWRTAVGGEVLAPPAIEGAIVVARTIDGRIFGQDANDGKRRWVYQRSTPALSVRTYTGATVERGAVFAGFPGGRLVALNLANGGVGWESVVALPKGTTELERVADVIGLPVVDGRQVCAVAFQGRVACFDAQTGTTNWARDLSSYSGMSTDGRNLYVTDDRNAVVALDKTTGASLWKQDKLFGRNVSAPVALGRFVVVGDFQGYLHFLSREDGSFAARIATDGSPIIAPPVAVDLSTLVVQTRNGGVYAVTLQ